MAFVSYIMLVNFGLPMITAILQALSVTIFVVSMMILIEYIHVKSRGRLLNYLQKKKNRQWFLGSALGFIPGCLGTYTAVSFFIHGLLSRGGLTATMIASSGDEAFIMLAMNPIWALGIFSILALIGLVGGWLTDKLIRNQYLTNLHFELHQSNDCNCEQRFSPKLIWSHPQAYRLGLFAFYFLVLIISIFALWETSHAGHQNHSQQQSHDHGPWMLVSLLFVSIVMLYLLMKVNDHFIKKHFVDHVIKKHFLKVFIWTSLALIFIHFVSDFIQWEAFIEQYSFMILLAALLIGIIPESGPHYILLVLFFQGSLPLSILLANSVVQDGHGGLPLLAENPKEFLLIKGINLIFGLAIGLAGILLHF